MAERNSDINGISCKEGSVTATARYLIDSRIYSLDQDYAIEDLISPIIPINDAHLVLGLEPLETIRNLKYISEQTVVILNTHSLFPRNVIIGSEKEKKYPSIAKIVETLDQFARRTVSMNFNKLSKTKFNNSIYANTIILGVGSKEYQEIFNKNLMIDLLQEFFGESKENIEAFELGYNLINP
ncbi:MAG: 2-oxoacid:acceptor oxidoreductase family protein [Candidatus Hermodarchaeota archaeon]